MSWCCCGGRVGRSSDEAAGARAEVRVPILPLGKHKHQQSSNAEEPIRISIDTPGRASVDEPTPEQALAMYRTAQAHCKAAPQHSALKHSESNKSYHTHFEEPSAAPHNHHHHNHHHDEDSKPRSCPFAEEVPMEREESLADKLSPLANDACCPIVGWPDEGGQLGADMMGSRRSTGDSSRGWRRTTSSLANKRVSFGGTGDSEVRVPHRIDSRKRHAAQEVSMKKIVDTLYKKVLDDPQLAPFFHNISLDRLKHMQTASMAMAFCGESPYGSKGPDLRQIHMPLIRNEGLGIRHWETWMKHFQATLDELPEIPEEQKENAIRCVRATRHYFKPLHSGETPRSSVSSM